MNKLKSWVGELFYLFFGAIMAVMVLLTILLVGHVIIAVCALVGSVWLIVNSFTTVYKMLSKF